MRHLHGWNSSALGSISQSEWQVKADQFVQLYKDTPGGQGASIGVAYDTLIANLDITPEIRAMQTSAVVLIVAKGKAVGEALMTNNEKKIFKIYKAVEYLANKMKNELTGVLPKPGSTEEADLQAQVLSNTIGENIDRTKAMLVMAKDGELAPQVIPSPESTPPETDVPVDSNPPIEDEDEDNDNDNDEDNDNEDEDDDEEIDLGEDTSNANSDTKAGWSNGKKIAIFGGCALALGGLFYYMTKKSNRINRLPR